MISLYLINENLVHKEQLQNNTDTIGLKQCFPGDEWIVKYPG